MHKHERRDLLREVYSTLHDMLRSSRCAWNALYTMSQAFDDALAATRETYGKVASLIQLVNEWSDYVDAHAEDPVALRAWTAEAKAKTVEIQAAIDENPLPSELPGGGVAGVGSPAFVQAGGMSEKDLKARQAEQDLTMQKARAQAAARPPAPPAGPAAEKLSPKAPGDFQRGPQQKPK
jgi:hypothetical protein